MKHHTVYKVIYCKAHDPEGILYTEQLSTYSSVFCYILDHPSIEVFRIIRTYA